MAFVDPGDGPSPYPGYQAGYTACFPLLLSLTIPGLRFLETTLPVNGNHTLSHMWTHSPATHSWFPTNCTVRRKQTAGCLTSPSLCLKRQGRLNSPLVVFAESTLLVSIEPNSLTCLMSASQTMC